MYIFLLNIKCSEHKYLYTIKISALYSKYNITILSSVEYPLNNNFWLLGGLKVSIKYLSKYIDKRL